MSLFPKRLDVFLTLVDGFHPITKDDMQRHVDALHEIEVILGTGVSKTTGGTAYGPKGGNDNVAQRLDTFLDPDGGLHDIAFVTGSSPRGEFSDQGLGKAVPFGKTLSSNQYAVIMMFQGDEVREQGGSLEHGDNNIGAWFVGFRLFDSCFIKSANDPIESVVVNWSCLAIGPEAAVF